MSDKITAGERQEAEWACERLIRRFAYLNDAHDHEGLAAMFTDDGVFVRPTDPDNPVKGREAIRAFFRDRPKRLTRHVMVNTLVDLDSATQARAISYAVLFTAPASDAAVATDVTQMVGEFRDLLVFENGEWRFAERVGSTALRTEAPK
jgi:uncharacterized protein (TIGR02246 family)